VVDGLPRETTLPEPLTTDHAPVPVVGAFALIVAPEVQRLWLAPAFAVVGGRSRVIETVSDATGQTPLVTVQANRFCPALKPVTFVAGLVNDVIVPVPDTTDHDPIPSAG
jgi:hypothetical protein